MASLQLFVLLLLASLSGKTLSTSVVSAQEQAKKIFTGPYKRAPDETQKLESSITGLRNEIKAKRGNVIENLTENLTRLEADISGLRNEIKEKRCETGVLQFIPFAQANLVGPNGYPRRTHTIHVNFARPFTTVPWVSIAMIHLDTQRTENVRVDLSVGARSAYGFDAHGFEWDSSKVYGVNASWIACSI